MTPVTLFSFRQERGVFSPVWEGKFRTISIRVSKEIAEREKRLTWFQKDLRAPAVQRALQLREGAICSCICVFEDFIEKVLWLLSVPFFSPHAQWECAGKWLEREGDMIMSEWMCSKEGT